MKLIQGWRHSHKFLSMQLMFLATVSDILLAGIVIVDQSFPFDPLWYVGARLTLTALSMGARLLAQGDKEANT